jgi:hypothetical protein
MLKALAGQNSDNQTKEVHLMQKDLSSKKVTQ